MRFVPVHAALLLAGSSSVAQAAPSRAVVVGSNRAGVGQVPLRWAGADADRVAAVLTELGGFAPEAVERLQDPSPDELIAAIDRAAEALAAEGPEGGRFVFYYSGHARSGSLTLGPDELSIDVLDLALEAVPAQQTLAVLDACQAGEPGVAKGAVPAAQFSFVSVAGLSTTGTAVVASSTADELSQESERLGASTFTHHWVTGLRGAADLDADGLVTLNEAYGYAYHRTVVDTAATAIGAQHPTLRIDLRGQGDWVLAQSSPASARLVLPAGLAGDVTVVHQESGHVMAEVAKIPDDAVTLALPPDQYAVSIRGDRRTCTRDLTLEAGEAATVPDDRTGCGDALEPGTAKLSAPAGGAATFRSPVSVIARVGVLRDAPQTVGTGGIEGALHLSPRVAVAAGVDLWATERVLPPAVQLRTGIYSAWDAVVPVNVGLVYAAPRTWVQPYAGLDAITAGFDGGRAWGGRGRIGVDLIPTPAVGFRIEGSLGAWSGVPWANQAWNAMPALSTGLVIAP